MKTVLLILTMCASIVVAEDVSEQAKSLKGLKSVAMEVDLGYVSTAERYGLREYEIAKKMKDMLEENGIRPMTTKEQEKDPNSPILRILVLPSIDEKYDACGISITVDLKQTVRLDSDKSIVVHHAATWRESASSLINVKQLLPAVSERVDTYLKKFIDDWLRANGKEPKYKNEKGKTEVEV